MSQMIRSEKTLRYKYVTSVVHHFYYLQPLSRILKNYNSKPDSFYLLLHIVLKVNEYVMNENQSLR